MNASLLNTLPERIGQLTCASMDALLVHLQHLAVAHQPAPGDHCGIDMLGVDAKEEMPGKVSAAERRGRVIVEQHQVGSRARTQFAHACKVGDERTEDSLDDSGVARE